MKQLEKLMNWVTYPTIITSSLLAMCFMYFAYISRSAQHNEYLLYNSDAIVPAIAHLQHHFLPQVSHGPHSAQTMVHYTHAYGQAMC